MDIIQKRNDTGGVCQLLNDSGCDPCNVSIQLALLVLRRCASRERRVVDKGTKERILGIGIRCAETYGMPGGATEGRSL